MLACRARTSARSSPATPTGWPDNSSGVKKTISRALTNAGITPQDVNVISAAANGGTTLDRIEADAYTEIFAGNKSGPWITALKGALGESFSGGGMRACALALSFEKSALPPTCGLINPLLQLKFVRKLEEEIEINNALLAGISFGGTYAYLVLGKCPKT
ncbi:MAG: hypothetical protein HGB33_03920 [Syntrophaceae bacterium]|nr:hypothetical protein [Syntrophaceae bacterium]